MDLQGNQSGYSSLKMYKALVSQIEAHFLFPWLLNSANRLRQKKYFSSSRFMIESTLEIFANKRICFWTVMSMFSILKGLRELFYICSGIAPSLNIVGQVLFQANIEEYPSLMRYKKYRYMRSSLSTLPWTKSG